MSNEKLSEEGTKGNEGLVGGIVGNVGSVGGTLDNDDVVEKGFRVNNVLFS